MSSIPIWCVAWITTTTRFFEFITEIEGNELTVCAGGRYDGLVEYFGGPATAGFGFGIGVERILLVLEKKALNYRSKQA